MVSIFSFVNRAAKIIKNHSSQPFCEKLFSSINQFFQQRANPFCLFGGKGVDVQAHMQLPCLELRVEAAFQLYVVEEIVVQGFGDVKELLNADVVTLEDGIHIGPCAVDAAGELGHADPCFVKHLFDKVSDMHSVRFGHRRLSLLMVKAANLSIWIHFVFRGKVAIIYGSVKIIYRAKRKPRKRHEKSVECRLSELRVTTPTPSNKFSTPC